jgi:hypothetical protein
MLEGGDAPATPQVRRQDRRQDRRRSIVLRDAIRHADRQTQPTINASQM